MIDIFVIIAVLILPKRASMAFFCDKMKIWMKGYDCNCKIKPIVINATPQPKFKKSAEHARRCAEIARILFNYDQKIKGIVY